MSLGTGVILPLQKLAVPVYLDHLAATSCSSVPQPTRSGRALQLQRLKSAGAAILNAEQRPWVSQPVLVSCKVMTVMLLCLQDFVEGTSCIMRFCPAVIGFADAHSEFKSLPLK